jgi:hypothetical protein
MAIRILRIPGDEEPLGKRWINQFTRDNPRVSPVIVRSIDAARINVTYPKALLQSYDVYEGVVRLYNIHPCDIWNTNEHGIALGICTKSTGPKVTSRH